ncbi:MAG: hypothetical protein V3S01_06855 [Dehalococcoidia bacterium]
MASHQTIVIKRELMQLDSKVEKLEEERIQGKAREREVNQRHQQSLDGLYTLLGVANDEIARRINELKAKEVRFKEVLAERDLARDKRVQAERERDTAPGNYSAAKLVEAEREIDHLEGLLGEAVTKAANQSGVAQWHSNRCAQLGKEKVVMMRTFEAKIERLVGEVAEGVRILGRTQLSWDACETLLAERTEDAAALARENEALRVALELNA